MNPEMLMSWVSHLGYIGLFLVIFVECGLFFGFIFPGDSLVFAAGLMATNGVLNLWVLVPLLVASTYLGYAFGYWFGDKLGHWLLARPDSMWFKRKHLDKAEVFYQRHGGKALVIGRLLPIVRTFVPIVAGMAAMPYRRFNGYNAFGAAVWAVTFLCLGYFLGVVFPQLIHYILPIALLIIIMSVAPGAYCYLRDRCRRQRQ